MHDLTRLLRLCLKYELSHLSEEIVRIFQELFPSTLDQWDRSHPTRAALNVEQPGWDILVANSAREHDLHAILPAALYKCSLHPWEVIAFGKENLPLLVESNRMALVFAAPKLLVSLRRDVFSFLGAARKQCSTGDATSNCKNQRAKLEQQNSIQMPSDPDSPSIDLLSKSLLEGVHNLMPPFYCKGCMTADRKYFSKSRTAMWNQLPGVFRLSGWDVLTSAKTSDDGNV